MTNFTGRKGSFNDLAQFLSIPSGSIDLSMFHSSQSKKEGLELHSELPYQYVKDNVEEYCGGILPGQKSLRLPMKTSIGHPFQELKTDEMDMI